MANRYWVGGTAAWDGTAGTKWALTSGGAGGQAVPTSADDVFFDANSGANTVTISTGNTGAKSITCTGFTGTLTGTANISVAGSITLVAGMTYSYTGTITITGTGTLTTAGKTISGITINGSGITVTLGDALALSAGSNITVTQGTFDTSASNYSVTCSALLSSNSNTRTINLNGSTVTCGGGNPVNFSTTGTLTLNAGTSTINCTSSSTSVTFAGANKTFNNVTFSGIATNGININGGATFNTLTLPSLSATGIYPVILNADITATTMVCSGTSPIQRISLSSNVTGTQRTITNTTWTTITDIDFQDIAISRSISGTRLGDAGNNTNITFPAPKTVYWNLAGAQNWSATGWATTSGGTPAANNFPLAQDTAVFNNAGSVTGTISIDKTWYLGTVDMSARTNAMTLSGNATVCGNWINGSGTTLSGASITTFGGRKTQTITSAGKTFPYRIWIDNFGYSVNFVDAFSSSDGVRLLSGTLDSGIYSVTVSYLDISLSNTKTLAFGSGTWTITTSGASAVTVSAGNTTITGTGTISLTSASAKTFAGGGMLFSGITLDQGGAGALTISGSNAFNNITNTYSATGATTITFTAGTTTTVNAFTASGSVGKVLTLNSSVAGSAATLSKSSGTVSVNYVSIQDSTATGGATWYAGANSTNVSGNTGWIFTAPPSGNFLMLM